MPIGLPISRSICVAQQVQYERALAISKTGLAYVRTDKYLVLSKASSFTVCPSNNVVSVGAAGFTGKALAACNSSTMYTRISKSSVTAQRR
eukprot:14382-Heterococcus_DN1.PRE.7